MTPTHLHRHTKRLSLRPVGVAVVTPASLPRDWTLVDGYLIGPFANLGEANLDGADLVDADLEDADLGLANLDDGDLGQADLDGAELGEADLTDASLDGATLTGVIWSNTTCPDGTNSDRDGGTCANDLG